MRGKIKYWLLIITTSFCNVTPPININAIESCPDLKLVFARGSGGSRWETNDYSTFKSTLESKLSTIDLDYDFIDLDYPAIGVGLDNLRVTAGAYFGAGEAYEFGESVNTGVNNLVQMINGTCPDTKYVIAGYSQGAMVVSKSLPKLDHDKLIYAATFGDPKLYLPEGNGIMPAACSGKNLSDYRIYVPDCQAHTGLLGAYVPYRPEKLSGKVGTWCNKMDIFCSSHFSIINHTSYVEDNLYEDASRLIFDKITKSFELKNNITSPHDTAILIDSTGSMGSLINKYKEEAYRLAKETLDKGGRVALFDYRDLSDPYDIVEHCNFESCTLKLFADKLDRIRIGGGGDGPESLLSSSFKTMQTLNWKMWSTKSLVILTDSNFLMPDRDGTTIQDVIALSKTIDPVNFYIITEPGNEEYYEELAAGTDGKVVTNLNELSLLTDYILERYDSLPRVEETIPKDAPVLNIDDMNIISDSEVKIKFSTTGSETIVILNDKVLGITNDTDILISNISGNVDNIISLIPLSNGVRGEEKTIKLNRSEQKTTSNKQDIKGSPNAIPKAPNTGEVKRN